MQSLNTRLSPRFLTGLLVTSKKYLEDAYLNQAGCYSLQATADPADPSYAAALACLTESKTVAMGFSRLPEWKVKVEKEAASKDLSKLQTACPTELKALLT